MQRKEFLNSTIIELIELFESYYLYLQTKTPDFLCERNRFAAVVRPNSQNQMKIFPNHL